MQYAQYLYCGLLAFAFATPALQSHAQTAQTPEVSPTGIAPQEDVIKEDLFTVTPVLETTLSADEAVPLELRFATTPNTSTAVQVDNITAEGFTRYVSVNGEQIAQVVVTRLKKDENFVDLDPDQFTSQFTISDTKLVPSTAVTVDGDEAEFVQAIANLNTDTSPELEEEEVADSQDSESENSDVEEGGGENQIADSYETPERLEQEEEEEREPNLTFNTSTEGCEPQIDLANGTVRQTSQTQTLEDGIVTETDACEPNGIVRTIQKNYEVCEDYVDVSGLVARPQYASFYNDDKGARYDLADCQPDDSVTFSIVENTDECTPDIDLVSEEVTLMSKLTYRNRSNVDVSVGECKVSETVFEMDRNYGTCSDLVSLDGGVARPQYTLTYTDQKASKHSVSECMPDMETAFDIIEKENCTLDFDYDAGTASVNTSLAYANETGVEVSVRECAPSETIAPIVMVPDASNCSLRHDFGSGVSTEMVMWTYEYGGQLFQASPCITTQTTYVHSKVYEKNGIDVCTAIVDVALGQAARQYRTEITVDGLNQTIAECQPDESSMLGIFATDDGCVDPETFTHDLAAGVSYGRERFYYTKPRGVKSFVTGCQTSEQTFNHSIALAGWRYNDADLRAQQLVDVSINVDGTPYQVATSYLAPGTSEVAYTFVRNDDIPDLANLYFDGCYRMVPTIRDQIYTRPDGTSYKLNVGAGDVVNYGDECHRVTETRSEARQGLRVTARSYTFYYNDGSGVKGPIYDGNMEATRTWIYSGNPPYAISTNFPRNGSSPYFSYAVLSQHYQRTKITYPDNSVGYTDWLKTELK